MYYAAIAAVSLVVNLMLNWDFMKALFSKDKKDNKRLVKFRYGQFLFFANCFFLTETAWGILYNLHDISELFYFVYTVTVLYFVFMLLTMLTWAQYIVAYIDEVSGHSMMITIAAWLFFLFGIVVLMLNRFYRFLFYYNDAHEYIPGPGRTIIFAFLLGFYLAVAAHMLAFARKTSGDLKVRCLAISCTSIILGVSMLLQIFYSFFPIYVIGLLIGACAIHSFVEMGEKKEKQMQYHIASVMVKDYEAIYYITLDTGEFLEFARSQRYDSMGIAVDGKNFYEETMDNIDKVVFPDDREYAKGFYSKETMIKNLEGKRSFSCKYRVVIEGAPRFFLFTYMYADDEQHIILYAKDIEDELNAEKRLKESQKETITFSQIAESMATNYDVVYYVDAENSSYIGYEFRNIYGQLQPAETGADFFAECHKNIPKIVHTHDQDRLYEYTNKDYLISSLEDRKSFSIDYRIVIDGRSRYTRMIARKSGDGSHLIICVENIDVEVRKEKEHLQALKTEKELARRDELTGVKNKTAYMELESSVQGNIDNGMDYLPFALVVCDCNNLKMINDTYGHAAGDEYIRSSAKLLCKIFVHSPVFRIGGDEFVVFLRADDYSARKELMEKLRSQVLQNKESGNGAILASGISDYIPGKDNSFADVFERADKEMYENKQNLKK